MSSWTDFRDGLVKEVVPQNVRDIVEQVPQASAEQAGGFTGSLIESLLSSIGQNGEAPKDGGVISQAVASVSRLPKAAKISAPILIAVGVGLYFIFRKRGRK